MIIKLKEFPPKKPTPPDGNPPKKNDPVPPEWREYDKRLDLYIKKLDYYEEDKGKAFVVVMGQCTTMMRTKLEGTDTYEAIEESDDVVGLLKLIRSLAYSTTPIRYPFVVAAEQVKRMINTRQGNDTLTTHYRKWTAGMEVMESVFGIFVPEKLIVEQKTKPEKETTDSDDTGEQSKDETTDSDTVSSNREDAIERFKACLFLLSLDFKRYGAAIDDMNNQHLIGHEAYPTTVEGVVNLLTHRTNNSHATSSGRNDDSVKPPKKKGGDDEKPSPVTQFTQLDTKQAKQMQHYQREEESEDEDLGDDEMNVVYGNGKMKLTPTTFHRSLWTGRPARK